MKPLFLNGSKPTHVLLDGPGLRIRADGVADRMFPLQRVSRVIVSGQVEWATNALVACAQAGVSISFLSHNGTLRARVLGCSPRENWMRLDTLLSEFLELGGGVARYRQWISGQAQQARRELIYAATSGPWPVESSMLAQILHQRALQYVKSSHLKLFDNQLRGLIHIQVETQFHAHQIDPDATDLLIHDVLLVADFTDILMWTLQNAKLTWLKRLYKQQYRIDGGLASPDWRHVMTFMQSQVSALDQRSAGLIRGLQGFLIDCVRSYGVQ